MEPELELAEPETLEAFAKKIERLHTELLFGCNSCGLDCLAEYHLAIAISSLPAIASQFRIAAIHQARALAGGR